MRLILPAPDEGGRVRRNNAVIVKKNFFLLLTTKSEMQLLKKTSDLLLLFHVVYPLYTEQVYKYTGLSINSCSLTTLMLLE